MPAIRRATVTSLDGIAFEAVAGSGHRLTMDAQPEHGGRGRGFSPMELLLVGLGGCTAMDVAAILRKMRQDVTAYRVEVEGTRRDEHPSTPATSTTTAPPRRPHPHPAIYESQRRPGSRTKGRARRSRASETSRSSAKSAGDAPGWPADVGRPGFSWNRPQLAHIDG